MLITNEPRVVGVDLSQGADDKGFYSCPEAGAALLAGEAAWS